MLVSIFYIVCGFLGYLIVLIASLKIKSNKAINGYLTLVITLIATRHLINGLSYFMDTIFFHKLIISSNRFFIFIIPSLYLYFREIIFPKHSFSVKDSLHYILPILFFISNKKNLHESEILHSFKEINKAYEVLSDTQKKQTLGILHSEKPTPQC